MFVLKDVLDLVRNLVLQGGGEEFACTYIKKCQLIVVRK